MTTNKSQGEALQKVDIYLKNSFQSWAVICSTISCYIQGWTENID
jgi:hypothetical protein